jgi:hypothetical protein
MPKTEEYLIDAADQLKRAVHDIRALAGNLEDISSRLLDEAVKLDTVRDKGKQPRGDGGNSPPRR